MVRIGFTHFGTRLLTERGIPAGTIDTGMVADGMCLL
ncbi:hypothetical protein CCACVL1_24361 [Corchorus capsularis]|uniref:Uncharacterized protein n=1 Tax=Corchorus capsularis TaxID=210143 RepID=A0A1R3GQ03_COCAP|nr:hypothetical protein CCACVL1_24361 [Corchorus capsularis]